MRSDRTMSVYQKRSFYKRKKLISKHFLELEVPLKYFLLQTFVTIDLSSLDKIL
jgi:hypothetical protein